MHTLMQDLRYALRMLRKNPGFTTVAVLTLALGIGANTTIFSLMNAVVLRFMPVPDPQQLVYLCVMNHPPGAMYSGNGSQVFSRYSFEQLRNQHDIFSDLMAFVPLSVGKVAVRYGENPEEAEADMVSGNFFSGLGVTPARGRTFTLQEEAQHAQVVVLSYAYWTRRFARNPSVIGQTLYVKGVPLTIVGVAARDFAGVEPGTPTDFWIPLQDRPDLSALGFSTRDGTSLYGTPTWWCLMMIGRLKLGVRQAQALAQLNPRFQQTVYQGLGVPKPKEQPVQIYFSAARGIGDGDLSQRVLVLMAMVGVVLVIACINVAMLLIARNSVRHREFSLRMAFGASRTRLFGQLLTESLLVVAAGAGLGWLFALWSTGALAAWAGLDISVGPDRNVLLFTLAVSLLIALVFGLAPLRNALRVPPALALKTSAANATQDRSKFRSGQVVVALQMALCLVLLVGAGLLLRTLRKLETVDLGMRARGLLVFGISPLRTLQTDTEVIRFYQALSERLRALPGVESATLMETRIGSGAGDRGPAAVDGAYRFGNTDQSWVWWNAVGPDYFYVLGTRLLLGRDLTDADSAAAPNVVVVNQTFVQRFLDGRDPIGHRLTVRLIRGREYTIVGVAANSKYAGVTEGPLPMAYLPYTQVPWVGPMQFALRTEGNPATLLPEVRRAVRQFGPDLPLLQPTTQQEQFENSFSEHRLIARLSTFFGLLAALLVATGLYGTVAYRVSRRTAEIGVRMALGAEQQQVLWMVLRESLSVTAVGVLLGLPLAIAAGRVLKSMLFGVGPGDPLAFAGALLGFTLVTLVASLIPARRAASVNPMVALRQE